MQNSGKLPPLEVEGSLPLNHPFWKDTNFIPDWLYQRVVYNNAQHPMLKEILDELGQGSSGQLALGDQPTVKLEPGPQQQQNAALTHQQQDFHQHLSQPLSQLEALQRKPEQTQHHTVLALQQSMLQQAHQRQGTQVQGQQVLGQYVQGQQVQGQAVQGHSVQGQHVQGQHVQGYHQKQQGVPQEFSVQQVHSVSAVNQQQQGVPQQQNGGTPFLSGSSQIAGRTQYVMSLPQQPRSMTQPTTAIAQQQQPMGGIAQQQVQRGGLVAPQLAGYAQKIPAYVSGATLMSAAPQMMSDDDKTMRPLCVAMMVNSDDVD